MTTIGHGLHIMYYFKSNKPTLFLKELRQPKFPLPFNYFCSLCPLSLSLLVILFLLSLLLSIYLFFLLDGAGLALTTEFHVPPLLKVTHRIRILVLAFFFLV